MSNLDPASRAQLEELARADIPPHIESLDLAWQRTTRDLARLVVELDDATAPA